MRKAVTLHDIAKETGVSFNTVSRALNGKRDVSPETRRQVLEAAKRLDYRPNRLAKGLRQRRTATIGAIIADLANPFFAEVVEGIERVAAARGYSIILANSEEDAGRELAAARTLVEHQVDGVLIAPTQQKRTVLDYLAAHSVPHCLLARFFPGRQDYAVVNDDRDGACQAVAHLLGCGHRRILFVNGPGRISSAKLRLEGYRQAYEEAGLPLDDALICETDVSLEGGHASVARALREKLDFTAVFCFSDYVSLGAMQALHEAGLSIPGDVGVMGYDDIALAAAIRPALSTVRIAKTRLGRTAGEKLIALIEGATGSERSPAGGITVLPPELVIRGTT